MPTMTDHGVFKRFTAPPPDEAANPAAYVQDRLAAGALGVHEAAVAPTPADNFPGGAAAAGRVLWAHVVDAQDLAQTRYHLLLDNTAAAAVWREIAVLNALGELEGPLLARASQGADVPITREVVAFNGRAVVGDDTAINGLASPIPRMAAPADGFAMLVRATSALTAMDLTCETVDGGDYVVDVEGLGATPHASGAACTTALTADRVYAVRVYASSRADAIDDVTMSAPEVDVIDLGRLERATRVRVQAPLYAADVEAWGQPRLTTLVLSDVRALRSLSLMSAAPAMTSLTVWGDAAPSAADPGTSVYLDAEVTAVPSIRDLPVRAFHVPPHLTGLNLYKTLLESLRAPGVELSYGLNPFAPVDYHGSRLDRNQLSADAINQFFEDLAPTTAAFARLHVNNNPGTATCDPSIAEAKGYTVDTEDHGA